MKIAGSALAIVFGLVVAPRVAEARPQHSVQGQFGVVGAGVDGGFWSKTRLDFGAKFESIWFREGPRDFGIGPYLEARTASFGYGEYGGGLVALLPVEQTFPVWFGGGAFARREDGAWGSGFNGFLAWGGRSFNHHGTYGLAFGLMADARVHTGPQKGFDLVLGATFDLQSLSYPLLYLVSALRH